MDDVEMPAKVDEAHVLFLSLIDNVAKDLKTMAEVKDEVPHDALFSSLTDYVVVQEAISKQRSSKTYSDLA